MTGKMTEIAKQERWPMFPVGWVNSSRGRIVRDLWEGNIVETRLTEK